MSLGRKKTVDNNGTGFRNILAKNRMSLDALSGKALTPDECSIPVMVDASKASSTARSLTQGVRMLLLPYLCNKCPADSAVVA